jgi:glucose/arabinose dehydrogenase
MKRIILFVILSIMTARAQQPGVETRPPNGAGQKPAFPGQTRAPEQKLNVAFDVVTVVQGLEGPWGLAFLPNGRMLVTERPGRLRIVGSDGKLSEAVAGLPAVDSRGQGGLLDVSLDPNFATNQLIYWSFSEPRGPRRHAVRHTGRALDHRRPHAVSENGQPARQNRAHQRGRLDSEGQSFRG